MRYIFIIVLVMLLSIAGCKCTKSNNLTLRSESIECQRLAELWAQIAEDNPRLIAPQTETFSGYEETWEEFGESVFSEVGCCFSKPLSSGWVEYNRLDCIWKYLVKEDIQRIAFYENTVFWGMKHPWAEVNEPERINKVISLTWTAMEKSSDRFANEAAIASLSTAGVIQIVTDKHKFIVPICAFRSAIRGVGWTSYELMEKLKQWNPDLYPW